MAITETKKKQERRNNAIEAHTATFSREDDLYDLGKIRKARI